MRRVTALLALFAVCCSALNCTEDPKCVVKPSGSLMNRVMPLILNTYEKCHKEHQCPLRTSALGSTACKDGKAGEFDCKDVDLLSFVPLADLGSSADGNDIWGWTHTDSDKNEREFALMCAMDGTSVVEVTDPLNPVVCGFLPTHNGRSSVWRDVKVHNNHMFVVADSSPGHGMQVFDLTQCLTAEGHAPMSHVRANSTWKQNEMEARILAASVPTLKATAHYDQFGSCHNIVINEETGYAYGVGSDTCRGGLHMVDIRDPTKPSYAGCFDTDGYTHDAQCVVYRGPDTRYTGKEICFAYNEDTLTIVDVSDKSNSKMLSRVGYADSFYTHQGWLDEFQEFLVMNDELDEVESNQKHTRSLLWDVRDLEKPVKTGEFLSSKTAVDHNLYCLTVKGKNICFEANYSAGLRIMDASRIDKGVMEEIAYFDVSPDYDDVSFHGSWSVYPFFSSGTVVVSSIERGLFVLKPNL